MAMMDSKYAHVQTSEVHARQDCDGGFGRPSTGPTRWWQFRGWNLSLKLGFIAALGVASLNLALLAWTVSGNHPGSQGISVVYTGSCDMVRNISTFGHLLINVLGSVLLAASNSCMQILSAPTRNDIDRAHSHGKWLDVGVNTMGNFRSMGILRRCLWIVLALSSMPLHLLYNSVLVESKVENNYIMVLGSSDFTKGGYYNSTRADNCFSTNAIYDSDSAVSFLQQKSDQLVRLENTDCIQAYSQKPLSLYGNLILVTSAPSNDSILNLWSLDSLADSNSWMCDGEHTAICDTSTLDVTDWTLPGSTLEIIPITGIPYYNRIGSLYGNCVAPKNQDFTVDYCLAQSAEESCTLGVSSPLLGVVLVCNLIKAICLFWTFRQLRFKPLVTVGDAISSFLERPDPTTESFGAIDAGKENWKAPWTPSAKPWRGGSRPGFSAASVGRWIICSILLIGFWILCVALLGSGLDQFGALGMGTDFASLVSNGLGKINPNELADHAAFNEDSGIAALAVITNLPQLLISLLYVLYNDLLTRILLAREWGAYAAAHKPLRVTEPRDRQIRAYFLSLPWLFSLPFLVTMMVLHWFASQSIFLAYITGKDYNLCDANGVPADAGIVTLGIGWSPLGLILALIVGGAMILALWLIGCMVRSKGGIPKICSSSAAISAACHPAPSDVDAAGRLVRYGVIPGKFGRSGLPCVGFSSGPVEPLVSGQLYS